MLSTSTGTDVTLRNGQKENYAQNSSNDTKSDYLESAQSSQENQKPPFEGSPHKQEKVNSSNSKSPEQQKDIQSEMTAQNSSLERQVREFKMQIEQRFVKSRANKEYTFPRPSQQKNDSSDDSLESLIDITLYNLQTQNDAYLRGGPVIVGSIQNRQQIESFRQKSTETTNAQENELTVRKDRNAQNTNTISTISNFQAGYQNHYIKTEGDDPYTESINQSSNLNLIANISSQQTPPSQNQIKQYRDEINKTISKNPNNHLENKSNVIHPLKNPIGINNNGRLNQKSSTDQLINQYQIINQSITNQVQKYMLKPDKNHILKRNSRFQNNKKNSNSLNSLNQKSDISAYSNQSQSKHFSVNNSNKLVSINSLQNLAKPHSNMGSSSTRISDEHRMKNISTYSRGLNESMEQGGGGFGNKGIVEEHSKNKLYSMHLTNQHELKPSSSNKLLQLDNISQNRPKRESSNSVNQTNFFENQSSLYSKFNANNSQIIEAYAGSSIYGNNQKEYRQFDNSFGQKAAIKQLSALEYSQRIDSSSYLLSTIDSKNKKFRIVGRSSQK